jgi:hypothetical protein
MKEIENQIERLRHQLIEMYNQGSALDDPKMINLSAKLDWLIHYYYGMRLLLVG